MLCAFSSLEAQMQAGETVLKGPLPDQAALYGALAQLEALDLELFEVRRDSGTPARRARSGRPLS